MKFKSEFIDNNEQLFKTILTRQSELEKLTTNLIELASAAKLHEKQAKNTFDWLTALKHNNSNLLSKAV